MLDYASKINYNIKASDNHRSAAKGQQSISSKVEKVSESKSEVGPKKKLAVPGPVRPDSLPPRVRVWLRETTPSVTVSRQQTYHKTSSPSPSCFLSGQQHH